MPGDRYAQFMGGVADDAQLVLCPHGQLAGSPGDSPGDVDLDDVRPELNLLTNDLDHLVLVAHHLVVLRSSASGPTPAMRSPSNSTETPGRMAAPVPSTRFPLAMSSCAAMAGAYRRTRQQWNCPQVGSARDPGLRNVRRNTDPQLKFRQGIDPCSFVQGRLVLSSHQRSPAASTCTERFH